MDGRKAGLPLAPIPQMLDILAPGSGVFTASISGVVTAILIGGASSGNTDGGVGSGGQGGGAVFKRFRISQGQSIPWVCGAGGAASAGGALAAGNPGTASTITLPSGLVVSATGAAINGSGSPGTGVNGDAFGVGGAAAALTNNPGNAGSNGGGAGSPGNVQGTGGGGPGGIATAVAGLTFPISILTGAGTLVGQGTAGNNAAAPSTPGGNGRVFMMLQRYAARP